MRESVTQKNAVISHRCPVCNAQKGTIYQAREMMLGTNEVFPYRECEECGCLWLTESPTNPARYYPKGSYYSLQPNRSNTIRKLRNRIYLSSASFLVNWRQRTDLDVIRRVRLTKSMAMLDVGCGYGHLIGDLRELGYNARGIDPFVPDDIHDGFGVRVQRRTLDEVTERFDIILFRHSLEHMPIDALRLVLNCLKPDGMCVVCIPVIGWAWQHYRTSWAQLDPPRHLFLHSVKSFGVLAADCGFRIERVVFDSTEFQFWASDSYRDNIPLVRAAPPGALAKFRMRRRAAFLNRRGLGDTAQFYLRRELTSLSSNSITAPLCVC